MKTYNGSEYLFQAEDHDEMISWIKEIKCNNNPDADVSMIFDHLNTIYHRYLCLNFSFFYGYRPGPFEACLLNTSKFM